MGNYITTSIVSLSEVPDATARCRSKADRPLVLIVDDEPLIVDTLAAILSREGFQTLRAYSGRTALQMAVAAQPDLLISDVFMPEMDGPALALCVARCAPACKVLLVSGHATQQDVHACHDAGLDFHLLHKPVHPAEMLRHVRQMLTKAFTSLEGAMAHGDSAALLTPAD